MKRYWKIISLSMLTVFIIGTFYIQTSIAAKTDLKITFETLSGDEAELEHLSFSADYEKANIYQSLRFSEEETVDLNKLSLLESLNRAYSNTLYKRLVEDYKGFMRGKMVSPENYYEDEHVLAYVEINVESSMKLAYEIDVFHKASGKNTAFKVDFPEKEKYNWANVAMVQVIEGKLKVFVRSSTEVSEMILATFDIGEQELEKSELLFSTSGDNWWDGRIIRDYQSIGYERYILFDFSNQGTEFAQETSKDMEDEKANTELMLYDLEKEEFRKIGNLDKAQARVDASTIYNSTLYIPSQVEEGIEVNQYDIEKQTWGEKIKFDVTSSKKGQIFQPYIKLINDKFYMVSAGEDGHTLLIGDTTSGNVRYEGVLKVKKDGEVQSKYHLYINELEVIQ